MEYRIKRPKIDISKITPLIDDAAIGIYRAFGGKKKDKKPTSPSLLEGIAGGNNTKTNIK